MRSPLRFVYRAILHLHPHSFRAEFGDEMLWIFDEESRNGSSTRLLLDGLRSIVVQRIMRSRQQPHSETGGPYYCEIESSLPATRLFQAGLIAVSYFFAISLFVSMVTPRLTLLDMSQQRDWLFTRIAIFSSDPPTNIKKSGNETVLRRVQ
jgi:hypothetical protein